MPHRLNDPDLSKRFQLQAASAILFFGQGVTLRKYISASGGNPELGIGDQWCYQLRPAIANLTELKLNEVQMIGGQNAQGGYMMEMLDRPDARDEIQYPAQSGLIYRVASEPVQENIGNTLYWKFYTLRAQISGSY